MSRASKMVVLAAVAAVMSAIAVFAMPADTAEAHVLVVTPPGNDKVMEGWVGIGDGAFHGLVGQSAAFENVPDEDAFFEAVFSSHLVGLNHACEGLRDADQDVVDIFGPPTPAGCPHGT